MNIEEKDHKLINQIRLKLYDICGDYRQIIQSIYRSPDFSQKHNMEYLDEQTSDVVEKALKYLKPKQQVDPVSVQQARQCILIISELQKKVQYILSEIKQRRLTFHSSMNQNKKSFQRTVNQLFENYSIDRKNEIQKFTKNIKKLKTELQCLQDTFETRLKSQIGLVIYEKDEFLNRFNSLNEKYSSMKTKLETELDKSKQKVTFLTQELKELEDSNAKLLKSLEDDYLNKIKMAQQEVSDKIAELEKVNNLLKTELKETIKNQENQIDDIQKRIKEKTRESEQDIEIKFKAKQNELESKLNEFDESQKRIENELLKKFNEQKTSNLKKIESLQLILTSLTEQANEYELNFSKKLKLVQDDNENRVIEKDKELQILLENQKNEIDELNRQNEEEIQFELKRNGLTYQKIEKEIIDLSNENKKQRIFLESELNNLIRIKEELELKFLEELKPKINYENFQISLSTIVNITSQENNSSNNNFLSIDEMTKRFQRFDLVSNQKQAELRDVKLNKKNELIAFKKEINELIQHEEGLCVALSDEINNKTIKFEKIQLQISELLKNQKNEEKKCKKEFKTKIKMQKDVIRQCKEELHRLKVEDLKKVQLSISQADHREEFKKLSDEIKSFKIQEKIDVENLHQRMEIDVKSERILNQDKIKDAQDKLNDALKKLIAARKEFIDDCEKDQQKWSELRIDIVNSNLKVFSGFGPNSQTNSRPGSSLATVNLRPFS